VIFFSSLFLSVAVSLVSFILVKKPGISPTRASSALSLFLFGLLYLTSSFFNFDIDYFASLVFGASFVGMCSHKIFNDLQVALAAIVYALVFSFCAPQNLGIGGALGFSAFASVFLIYSFTKVELQ